MLRRLATRRGNILPDLIAGATVAAVRVPQSMAHAVLASVNPMSGIYALMIAMPVGALLTSSVFMNVSASGALAIAVGDALYEVPYEQKVGALMLMVLMIGAAQFVMGLLGLGRLTRYVSNSVLSGFMLGVSILIILTSVRDITGFQSRHADHFLRLAETVLNWRQFELASLGIGLVVIVCAFVIDQTRLYKFSLVIALMAASAAAIAAENLLPGFSIKTLREVTYLSPYFEVPGLPDVAYLLDFIVPAATIAVIGLVQSSAVGQSFPNPDKKFPDASRDFMGQGAANMASSFFGAIPSNGSLPGTSILVKMGARTCWANIFGGGFVLLIFLLFLPAIELIPIAAMGGLLFVVGLQNIQFAKIRDVWTTGVVSRSALLGTLLATLFLPLHIAILLGVALSFLLQVLHLANRFELRQLQLVDGGFPVDLPGPIEFKDNSVCLIYVKGVLFFASAAAFEDTLPPPESGKNAAVVLMLQDVDEIGSTIVKSLVNYSERLERHRNKLMLAGVSDALKGQLDRTGLTRAIGAENIYVQKNFSGESVNEAMIAARSWIGKQQVAS